MKAHEVTNPSGIVINSEKVDLHSLQFVTSLSDEAFAGVWYLSVSS